MKAEDVPIEWMRAAENAWNVTHATGRTGACMRAAIAAVAPLIAKAERERCANLAEDYVKAIERISGLPAVGVVEAASLTIAAAIRALPDGEVGG